MIKDLLVPVVLGGVSPEAVAVACALAARHEGHVTGLISIGTVTPASTAWEYFPVGVYEAVHDAAKVAADKLSKEVRVLLAQYPVSSEVRVSDTLWLSPPQVAVLHAQQTDLVVMGCTRDALSGVEGELFADLLFDTGRPVLVVPPQSSWPDRLEKAVVAWRPGREASRALHDAIPLLCLAGSVDLVMVEPKVGEQDNGELPGAEVAVHLARHGLDINVVSIAREGQRTGEAILRYAQQVGAGLIVAGGFGHSRLRQFVFGGVTRTLFDRTTVPVLFSH